MFAGSLFSRVSDIEINSITTGVLCYRRPGCGLCSAEQKNIVRIFIHTPKNYRVKKIIEMYGDMEQEGKKNIARSDAVRDAYYKSIYSSKIIR